MGKISVKWVKSGIGRPYDQRRTLESLGLKKLNQTVVHEETPSILGMVKKVSHLVVVESKAK
ncbi:MAG: 50S ribosomal protein L30 [Chloroflexi bacterium]|nr:50S ribosomal protein L30 [Chloroflexota bacterium]|tara:strand:- start:666 stop:851 length:186 start_codon:yes stop_codon:yes gene_type:complete